MLSGLKLHDVCLQTTRKIKVMHYQIMGRNVQLQSLDTQGWEAAHLLYKLQCLWKLSITCLLWDCACQQWLLQHLQNSWSAHWQGRSLCHQLSWSLEHFQEVQNSAKQVKFRELFSNDLSTTYSSGTKVTQAGPRSSVKYKIPICMCFHSLDMVFVLGCTNAFQLWKAWYVICTDWSRTHSIVQWQGYNEARLGLWCHESLDLYLQQTWIHCLPDKFGSRITQFSTVVSVETLERGWRVVLDSEICWWWWWVFG